MMRRPSLAFAVAALLALAACGRSNPVLGEWELDRSATDPGSVAAVEAARMENLKFERDSVSDVDTTIQGSYVVEEGRVRFVRGDGNGEHVIELLDDERIDVDLPIGVHAIYKRPGAD